MGFQHGQPPVRPSFDPQNAPQGTENIDDLVVLEPEYVGQQDEDPKMNMQPNNNNNNYENGVENSGHQPYNDDLDIIPDANPLPNNVDHWMRRSTRIRRNVSRFGLSLHYIMLTDEGEPLTYKEAKAS